MPIDLEPVLEIAPQGMDHLMMLISCPMELSLSFKDMIFDHLYPYSESLDNFLNENIGNYIMCKGIEYQLGSF